MVDALTVWQRRWATASETCHSRVNQVLQFYLQFNLKVAAILDNFLQTNKTAA